MPSAEAISHQNHSEDVLQNSQYGKKCPSRRCPRTAPGGVDKTTIMIIVIIGMTMITQIPVCFVYAINYFLLGGTTSRINMPDYIDIMLHWLLLLNSAADPVIYGVMNPPFKKAYLKFFNGVRDCLTTKKRENVAARTESHIYKLVNRGRKYVVEKKPVD